MWARIFVTKKYSVSINKICVSRLHSCASVFYALFRRWVIARYIDTRYIDALVYIIHIETDRKFWSLDFQIEADSNSLAGEVYLELQINLRILCYGSYRFESDFRRYISHLIDCDFSIFCNPIGSCMDFQWQKHI